MHVSGMMTSVELLTGTQFYFYPFIRQCLLLMPLFVLNFLFELDLVVQSFDHSNENEVL